MRILSSLLCLVLAMPAFAGPIEGKVESALAAESRPDSDRARDDNRKPLETLQFFGLEDDMRVLDLMSSWTSHLPETARPASVSETSKRRRSDVSALVST